MEKIRFITDSASDMNHPREDVTILPLHIRFGDDEYADGVTISHREFYEKLIECDTLPTTSLVSPAVFEDAYEQAVSAGETVIVITISGKLSGTCQSARIAAEDYEGKVFVIDSMNATIGERILVEYGLQLKDQGKSAEEIVSILEKEKSKIHTMGLLDTLEYLKKGGRITPAAAALGTLLKLKPVLQIQGEKLDAFAKARTVKQAKTIMTEAMKNDFEKRFHSPDGEKMNLELAYTFDTAAAEAFKEEVQAVFPDNEIVMQPLSLSIACHIGPGALAIACSKKIEA